MRLELSMLRTSVVGVATLPVGDREIVECTKSNFANLAPRVEACENNKGPQLIGMAWPGQSTIAPPGVVVQDRRH